MEWRNVLFISFEATGFLLCESWQFITAAVKRGNKEWQKLFYSQGNGVSEDLFGKVMALLLSRSTVYNFQPSQLVPRKAKETSRKDSI